MSTHLTDSLYTSYSQIHRAVVQYSSTTTGEIHVIIPAVTGLDTSIPVSYFGREAHPFENDWVVPNVGASIIVCREDEDYTSVFWINTTYNPVRDTSAGEVNPTAYNFGPAGSVSAFDLIDFGSTPTSSGLYLGSVNMGYYNHTASEWRTYMDYNGNFYLRGSGTNALTWNGSTLAVSGAITASTIDIGTDNTILKVDATGNLSIGHATPSLAPFQVSTAGSLTTSDITITGLGSSGIDIGGTDSTSWHVDPDGNMWWGTSASYSGALSKIANWGGAYLLYARIGGAAESGTSETGKAWEINEGNITNVSTHNSIAATDGIAIGLNSVAGIFRAAGGKIIARGYSGGDVRMGIAQTNADQPTWNLAGDIVMSKESGNIRFSVEQALTVDNGDVTVNDGLTLTGNPTNSVGSYMLSRNSGGSLVWNGTAVGGTYTWGRDLTETSGTVDHDLQPWVPSNPPPHWGGYGTYIRTLYLTTSGHITGVDYTSEDNLSVYCDAPTSNPGSVPDRHVKDAISMNFGDSEDFKIQHSGTNTYLSQGGFGQLYVRHINSGHLYLQSGSGGKVYLQTGATNNTSSQTTALHCTGANVHVAGTLSKSSGSFDIVHPVVEGKRLRHSFIEGPQADLIYRGTTELGAAPTVINMDTEFDMTPGTWEALNCTPWSMVSASGKVVEWEFEGSTLTITGDEGTVCNWMVIGERHDDHMKSVNCDIASSDGRVVLEYLDSENDNDGNPGDGISMGGNGGSREGSPLGAPPAE